MLPSIIHSYLPRCILYVLSIDYAYYANLRCVLMLCIYDTHSTCYGSMIHAILYYRLVYAMYALHLKCMIMLLILLQSTRYILPSLADMIILSVVILYILSIYNTCYKCYRSIMHIHAIDLYASYVYSYHHILSLFRLCDPLYTSSMYLSVPALVHTLDLQCMLSALPL